MNYVILISTALVLPALFWFHTSRVDSLKQRLPTGQSLPFRKKLISWWTGLMLLIIGADVFGLWVLGPEKPKVPELQFFDTSAYKEEIEELEKLMKKQSISDGDVSELVRIFRHAERLLEKRLYSDAEKVFQGLRHGRDETGPFVKLDSYVVSNNLGVISFYIRRNKNFRASDNLLRASRMPHLDKAAAGTITDNLEKLDESVNRLD